MAWNGSGTFSLDPAYSPEVDGTVIEAGRYNGLTNDIATGITNCLSKDGQNTPTANLPMGSRKLTGLAAGSAAGDSVRYEQANVIGETTVTGSASSADVFAAATARVLFDGAGLTVTAVPSSSLNTWKLVRFNGVNTLTHSAGFSLPGGGNLTTASGDVALMLSVGSNTLVADYFPAAGVSARLNSLLSALAANTLANADFAQVWNWSLTTASKVGLTIGESSASSGSGATLLAAVNASGSTARPFVAQWTGVANGQIGFATDGDAQLVAPTLTGVAGPDVVITAGAAGTTTAAGGNVSITAGDGGSSSGAGGDITLTPGDAAGLTQGDIRLCSHIDAAANPVLVVQGLNGHIAIPEGTSTAPTLTSGGGTGATVTGRDSAFRITLGTSPGTTAMLVDFKSNFSTSAPFVFAKYHGKDVRLTTDISTSSITLTPSTTMDAGDLIDVICIASV